jgi:hypothetical protein
MVQMCGCYICISASSQPTVHELVYKATLDTSGGGGGFWHRKIGEPLHYIYIITLSFWSLIKATLAGTRE